MKDFMATLPLEKPVSPSWRIPTLNDSPASTLLNFLFLFFPTEKEKNKRKKTDIPQYKPHFNF
jgi:hypothetical protein